MEILATGQTAANRAKVTALSPLLVEEEGFKALGQLGGGQTAIYLGDWSQAPAFLFPRNGPLALPNGYTLAPLAPPKR